MRALVSGNLKALIVRHFNPDKFSSVFQSSGPPRWVDLMVRLMRRQSSPGGVQTQMMASCANMRTLRHPPMRATNAWPAVEGERESAKVLFEG